MGSKVCGRWIVGAVESAALGVLLAAGSIGCGGEDSTETFQIALDSFTVPAGMEGLHCQQYPMPEHLHDRDLSLVGWRTDMPRFTHHFFMGYSPREPDFTEPRPCGGEGTPAAQFNDPGNDALDDTHGGEWVNDAKMVMGAGAGEYAVRLPEGYGSYLAGGRGFFQDNLHLLNTSSEDFFWEGTVDLEFDVADYPARSLVCGVGGISVPPRSTATIEATCTVPFDLVVVAFASHAHQYMTRFEQRFFDGVSVEEDPFYVNTEWDQPNIQVMDPPMHFRPGQGIHFKCYYENDTDTEVVDGIGEFGEMCVIMNLYGYPADRPHELPPTLWGAAQGDGGRSMLFDTSGLPVPF
jgi:hypothetical protein